MGAVLEGGQPESPAIQVRSALGSDIEREVLAGIEEEGVPFVVVRPRSGGSAHDLAREAARRSSLDVGIGIDADGRISVTHELLGEPVEGLVSGTAATASFARRAGHNAARIVVGIPLRL